MLLENGSGNKLMKNKDSYINELTQQMEYYFSDVNLVRDRFLLDLIGQHQRGFVDLSCFLKFNRVKEIFKHVHVRDRMQSLIRAVEQSSTLQLNKCGNMVKRKEDMNDIDQIKSDKEARTLYVENLYKTVNRKRLSYTINTDNDIESIEIPMYVNRLKKENKGKSDFNKKEKIEINKGFAFIILKDRAKVTQYKKKLDGYVKKFFSCGDGLRVMKYSKWRENKNQMNSLLRKLKTGLEPHRKLQDYQYYYIQVVSNSNEFMKEDIILTFKQLNVDVYNVDFMNKTEAIIKLYSEEDFEIIKDELNCKNPLLNYLVSITELYKDYLKEYLERIMDKRNKVRNRAIRKKAN